MKLLFLLCGLFARLLGVIGVVALAACWFHAARLLFHGIWLKAFGFFWLGILAAAVGATPGFLWDKWDHARAKRG